MRHDLPLLPTPNRLNLSTNTNIAEMRFFERNPSQEKPSDTRSRLVDARACMLALDNELLTNLAILKVFSRKPTA